jgi:tetratricopeptide (TPR) repeat protein
MRGRSTIVAVAMCIATSVVALAQSPTTRDCAGPDANVAITACTSILSGGKRVPPPVAVPALNYRGIAYVKLKDYDRAIADYTAALRLEPNNPRPMNLRGIAYRLKGEYDAAIADYDAVLKREPNNAQTYNNRGQAYRWKGDYDRALADFNQAIKLNPTYPLSYGGRAAVYRLKLDFPRAIADHNMAIRYNSQFPPAYYNRGTTYEAQGDYPRALADYRQALALGAKNERVDQAVRRVEQRIASGATAAPTAPAPPSGTAPSRDQQAGQPAGNQQAGASSGAAATQAATAGGETRVALVIGNSKYANVPALANPQRDAQALASALQRIGFNQVTLKLDLPRDKMIDELKSFAAAADRADWAVVYFAGHGLEVSGVNYLVPTEAKFQSDRDVSFEGVPLEQVLQAVDGARKLGIVVLDACRDNPFVKTMTRSLSGTRSVGTGLANIEPEGAVLVAYAARHGQTALYGGTGANSPFMSALLKNIETPGLEINLLFRKIHDDVMTATAKRQEPFTYGSLPSEAFYFRKP